MREVISSPNAPEAVGNYSQAVKAGDFYYFSGQICVNPHTGEMDRESITSQTIRCMENIKAIVEEIGATMDDVIRCRVAISDMKHFPEFDRAYGAYFTKPYPARITVAAAGIYDNLDIEIDVVVYKP